MLLARTLSDEGGESHFDEVEIPFSETDFIAGAQPIGVSEPWIASQVSMLSVPPGWSDSQHPTPVRQIVVILSGGAEITTSDGEIRVFEKGDAVLLADLEGKGHGTRFASDEATLIVSIRLA